ncbi:hypothetical protein NP234_24365, partial [Salmonella enterica]|nr:hypothetical protein [Salmonella enterica]
MVQALQSEVLQYIELEKLVAAADRTSSQGEELQHLKKAEEALQEAFDLERGKNDSLSAEVARLKEELAEKSKLLEDEGAIRLQLEASKAKEVAQTREEAFSQGHLEGQALGHSDGRKAGVEEGRVKGVEEFLASAQFAQHLDLHLKTYKDSAEFEELQLELMKAAGDQILARFKKHRPEVDLGFLDDESTEEGGDEGGEAGTEEG